MKNMNIKRTFTLLGLGLLAILLTACGGGGSGSGGGSDFSGGSSIFPSTEKSASTGIRLLHGASDAGPVDLLLSSKEGAVATARFALAYPFISASGTQIATVVPTNQLSPNLFSSEITLEKNTRGTVLLYGNNEFLGLSTVYLPDSRNPELGQTSAAIRVIHALVGASELAGSAGKAPFGRASSYIEVPAGPNTVSVTRVADGRVVYSGTVDLAGDTHYSLFVSGRIDYYTKTNLLED